MPKSGPILIVEDDADDQYLLRRTLEKLKVKNKTLFFSNGRDALEYLINLETTRENPFLILCDINMPVMNGLELQENIHKNEALRRKSIPFVFLTTSAQKSDVDKAYNMMVQGYFEKAASMEEFESIIRLIIKYWTECKHPNSFNETN